MAKKATEDGEKPSYNSLISRTLEALKASKSGSFSRMTDGMKRSEPRFFLPTGVTLLDEHMGGGLPVGRLIELIGAESTSKTLLGLNWLAKAVELEWLAAFMDTEIAPSMDFAARLGHLYETIMANVIYNQALTIEAAGNSITEMITRARGGVLKMKTETGTKVVTVEGTAALSAGGPPMVYLWDSFAGLPSKEEMAVTLDTYSAMGRRAYKIKLWLMCELQRLAEEQVLLIMTNHVTAKFDGKNKYDKETSPGGSALRHFASIRLKLKIIETIRKSPAPDPLGTWIEAQFLKTRFGPGGRKVKFPVYYDRGVDDQEAVFQYLYERSKLGKKPGYAEWDGKHYHREPYLDLMRKDPVMYAALQDRARTVFRGEPPEPDVEDEIVGPMGGEPPLDFDAQPDD